MRACIGVERARWRIYDCWHMVSGYRHRVHSACRSSSASKSPPVAHWMSQDYLLRRRNFNGNAGVYELVPVGIASYRQRFKVASELID